MTMKKIFILLVSVCISHAVLAQSNATISYAISFPTGDISDFIEKTSFRGMSFDYRYKFQPKMALGASVGWTTFYEEVGRGTYTAGSESLTGKQFRYSNHVPMVATFTYFTKEDDMMVPYATFGIGTMYTRRDTDMSVYRREQEAWNFLFQPEIGIQVHSMENAALALSLKYNVGLAAGSELSEAQSYISFHVGLAFF
jgi:hypothetical protein